MQASSEPSQWPKRLMIAGLIMGFLGVVSFSVFVEDFNDYNDPREMAEHSAEFGQVNMLTLTSGCWVVNIEGDDSNYDIEYEVIENGEPVGTVDEDCRSDFQAQAVDVDFSRVTTLKISKTTEVLVTISCQESDGCANKVLFTNGESVLIEILGDVGFLATIGTCCLGAVIFPLGWILVTINKNKQNKVHLTQEEVVASVSAQDHEFQNNRELLTTDQLYKLVRGEMPEFEQKNDDNVPSPFATDTRPRPAQKKTGSIYQASTHTPENPPTDESWKNWDES